MNQKIRPVIDTFQPWHCKTFQVVIENELTAYRIGPASLLLVLQIVSYARTRGAIANVGSCTCIKGGISMYLSLNLLSVPRP